MLIMNAYQPSAAWDQGPRIAFQLITDAVVGESEVLLLLWSVTQPARGLDRYTGRFSPLEPPGGAAGELSPTGKGKPRGGGEVTEMEEEEEEEAAGVASDSVPACLSGGPKAAEEERKKQQTGTGRSSLEVSTGQQDSDLLWLWAAEAFDLLGKGKGDSTNLPFSRSELVQSPAAAPWQHPAGSVVLGAENRLLLGGGQRAATGRRE